MKKYIIITIILIIFIFGIFYIISKTIDTRYAIMYSHVFGSYNIEKVDKYLNNETLITYNGVTDTYKNLRKNLIAAFEAKDYIMVRDSSYGHGDDTFVNGVQEIGINTYVDSEKYISSFVSMEIERHWLLFYEIKTMTSDDDFFGYLFFGIKK